MSFSGETVYCVTALSNSDVKVHRLWLPLKPILPVLYYSKNVKIFIKPFATQHLSKTVLLQPSPFLQVKK